MSRKRIPEAVYRGGLQSTGEALDTQAGLLSAALSPLFVWLPQNTCLCLWAMFFPVEGGETDQARTLHISV